MLKQLTDHRRTDVADTVAASLARHTPGPYYYTPDGVQAPLLDRLADVVATQNVVREDIAVALAAGAYLAGGSPVVLMQNSGLGQSVNALASLVLPYRLGMLLVVGMRGTAPDTTEENQVMGAITERLLAMMNIPVRYCGESDPEADVATAMTAVRCGRPAAVLIRPGLFGWSVSG